MAIDLEDVEKFMKLAALVQQGAAELMNMVQNKKAQGGRTTEENFDHAEKANQEARQLIDSL